ncbi:hypothetical protein HY065_01470 [Candidatus Berkelbacteria bacterium]|nr:hypothetical protein [Candidatus Berkelbacteria bacterium]
MYEHIVRSIQRGVLAFGISLAFVGAATAQINPTPATTTTTTATQATATPVASSSDQVAATQGGDTSALEGEPAYQPESSIYGLRLGLYNAGTSIVGLFNKEAANKRRLTLNDEYAKEIAHVTQNNLSDSVLAKVTDRKADQDEFLKNIASADPTLKDEVAKAFAKQQGLFLGLKLAAPEGKQQGLEKVLGNATVFGAQLAGVRGLPDQAIDGMRKAGLSEDQINSIKSAAQGDPAAGFRAFQQVAGQNPQLKGLLEAGYYGGNFQAVGGQVFGGQLPPQLAQQFQAANGIAQAEFLKNIGQDPEAAKKFASQAQQIAKEFANNTAFSQGAPAFAQGFQEFQQKFASQFGSQGQNFNPSDFSKQFQSGQFGSFPSFGGGPSQQAGPGGQFQGGPGNFGGGGSYSFSPSPNYHPSDQQQQQYQQYQGSTRQYQQPSSSGSFAPQPTSGDGSYSYSPTATGSYTTSPSPTSTQTSSPSATYTSSPTPTSTATSSPTPTSTSGDTHGCPSGYYWNGSTCAH